MNQGSYSCTDDDLGLLRGEDVASNVAIDLLVESPVLLKTADGQLDERWSIGRFRSFDSQRAIGRLTLKTAAIQGAYESNLASNQCLLGLQFDESFSAAEFFRKHPQDGRRCRLWFGRRSDQRFTTQRRFLGRRGRAKLAAESRRREPSGDAAD